MSRTTRYQGAIMRDDHILLLKQMEHASGRSYWLIPGGGIEPGETEEQCVAREMQEETSLTVEVQSLLLDEPGSPAWPQRKKTYVCRIVGGEARPGYEPEEEFASSYTFTELGWFDLRKPATWNAEMVADAITYPQLRRIQAALGYAVAGDEGSA